MASHAGLVYVLETNEGYIDENGNIVKSIAEAYPINFERFGYGPSPLKVYMELGFYDKKIIESKIRFHTIIPSYDGRLGVIESYYEEMGYDLRQSVSRAHDDFTNYRLENNTNYLNYIKNLKEKTICYYKNRITPERVMIDRSLTNLYKIDERKYNDKEGLVERFYSENDKMYRYSILLNNPKVEKYFNLSEEEYNYLNNWQTEGLVETLKNVIQSNKFNCSLGYDFKIFDLKINNDKLTLYSNELTSDLVELIEKEIRKYFSKREMHITRMFGSYILLRKEEDKLNAIMATAIPIKYCPLMIKLLKEVGGETAMKLIEILGNTDEKYQTKIMCDLINEVVIKGGYFDTNRPLNSCEANVLFGASETISSAFKTGMIDAAVIVSNNLGTIITTNDLNTQGAVKRMTGLFYTSPNEDIVTTAIKEGIIPVYPYTAQINQIEGIKKAIKMGYKKIAVSVAAHDNILHEKIAQLENEYGLVIYKFGLCSTGIEEKEAVIMQKYADVVWSCASKYVKELIEPNSLAQVGIKIPIHIMTKQGWKIVKNHLELMINQDNLEEVNLQLGDEKPVLLNNNEKIKVLKKKNLHNCNDCPYPCV